MVNTAALVLFGVWFVVIFVVRSWVQKRDTGDSGIRPGAFAADASILERAAYVLLLVAFAAAVGFAVMVPNVIAVIAVVFLVVAIEMQVRFVEEPHLRRLHGTGYEQYAAEVGRFYPLVGRGKRAASAHLFSVGLRELGRRTLAA